MMKFSGICASAIPKRTLGIIIGSVIGVIALLTIIYYAAVILFVNAIQ